MSQLALPGTATPADILSGQTASSSAGFNFAGTMPAQGSPTFTPTTSAIAIPAGNYTGGTVAAAVLGAQGSLTVAGSTSYTITAGFPVNQVVFSWATALGTIVFDTVVTTADCFIVNSTTAGTYAVTYSTSGNTFTINVTGVGTADSGTLTWAAIS